MSTFNILQSAKSVRNIDQCLYDSNTGFEVVWSGTGDDLGWNVLYNLACVGVSNGVWFATSTDSFCFVNRDNPFSYVDAAEFTKVAVTMAVKKNPRSGNPCMGKLAWRRNIDPDFTSDCEQTFGIQADGEWHTYIVDLTSHSYWKNYVNNLRVYPLIDGYRGEEVYIKRIRIFSDNYFKCGKPVCSYYHDYKRNCPGKGSGGYSRSLVPKTSFTIRERINDSLIVDINNCGDWMIRLAPGEDLSGHEVARDLENKLSLLGIGPYLHAICDYDGQFFTIGTTEKGSDTSVVVKAPSEASVAETLGFYSGGVKTAEEAVGNDPATEYKPKHYKLPTYRLNNLGSKTASPVEYGTNLFKVSAGNPHWHLYENWVQIDASYYTVVDFSFPFQYNGRIESIFLNGEPIEGVTCFKIFRPRPDGKLEVVWSSPVWSKDDNKIYSSLIDKVRVNCDVDVLAGDLIGVYGAKLNAGRILGGAPEYEIKMSYYRFSGNVSGVVDIEEVVNYGEQAIPVFARSEDVVEPIGIEVDLGSEYTINDVILYGPEFTVTEEFNLMRTGSADIQVDTFDLQHGHSVKNAVTQDTFQVLHNNVAVNVYALNDGRRTALNGVAGQDFEQTDPTEEAAYFYITGDAEWLNTREFTYPLSATVYGFEDDKFKIYMGVDPDPSIERDIHRVVMYFKEPFNIRNFQWEYKLRFGSGNGSSWQFQRIPSYTGIVVDGTYDETGNIYLRDNPCDSSISWIGSGMGRTISNKEKATMAAQTYWTSLSWEWEPVRTNAVQLYCTLHKSTKITEIEVYTKIETTTNLSTGTEIFLQASKSDPTRYTGVIYKDTSEDGAYRSDLFVTARYLTLIFSGTRVILDSVKINIASDAVVARNEDLKAVERMDYLNPEKGVVGPAKRIYIENRYGKPCEALVDVDRETESSGKVLLSTKMDSLESITNPDIGAGGRLFKLGDLPWGSDLNVGYRGRCYGLVNIAEGKRWYTSTDMVNWITASFPIDNRSSDYPEEPNKYACVDLGRLYDMDVIWLLNNDAWPETPYQFSDSDTDDIDSVVWGSATQIKARWVLWKVDAIGMSGGTVKTISAVLIVQRIQSDWDAVEWDELDPITLLTDDSTLTHVNSSEYPVICVDMYYKEYIRYIRGTPLYDASTGAGWRIDNVSWGSNSGDDPADCVWSDYRDRVCDYWNGSQCTVNLLEGVPYGVEVDVYGYEQVVDTYNGGNCDGAGTAASCNRFSLGCHRWVAIRESSKNETLHYLTISSPIRAHLCRFKNWWVPSVTSLSMGEGIPDTVDRTLRIHYPASNEEETVHTGQRISGTPHWTADDFIEPMFKVSDPGAVESIKLRLGVNSDTFYEWNLTPYVSVNWTSPVLLVNEASLVHDGEWYLQGDNAWDTPQYTGSDFEYEQGYSALTIRGKGLSFIVELGPIILRRNTCGTDVRFGKGYYLTDGENIIFPAEGLNLKNGAVEFWFKPSQGLISSGIGDPDPQVCTFFRILDERENLVTLGYTYNYGLFLSARLGTTIYFRRNVDSPITFSLGETYHIRVIWDRDGYGKFGNTVAVYLNGKLVLSIPDGDLTGGSSARLCVGHFVSLPYYRSYAKRMSVSGAMEDLRVYDYANLDFSDVNKPGLGNTRLISPDEMVEISLDGLNFYRGDSNILPLRTGFVDPGETFPVWVRPVVPRNGLTGMEKRTANLVVTWIYNY